MNTVNVNTSIWGRRGRDHMVVGFTTTYAISALSALMFLFSFFFRARSTTLCDNVCQWFSPGSPVSSTNKTDRHYISEILLKVTLNTIKQTNKQYDCSSLWCQRCQYFFFRRQYCLSFFKKSLKISESVNQRRTDNTMAKRRSTKLKSNTNPTKN